MKIQLKSFYALSNTSCSYVYSVSIGLRRQAITTSAAREFRGRTISAKLPSGLLIRRRWPECHFDICNHCIGYGKAGYKFYTLSRIKAIN